MKQLIFSCFGILSLISASIALFSKPKEGHFRAAVYEHDLIVPDACLYKVCSREEAISLMEVNLQILEEQVLAAARNGAQIILLPEDGIHGFGHMNRQALRYLSIKISILPLRSNFLDHSWSLYLQLQMDLFLAMRMELMMPMLVQG